MTAICITSLAGRWDLEVYECECGFHIGLDATYLEQVEEVVIECPSCGSIIDTGEIE